MSDPDASTHLKRLIALKGPLSLSDFMTEALWHPSVGYYARSAVLGAEGDYVTAPEISQMFGELLGLWCASVWQAMGSPHPFRLIELGPGRGLLMADALRVARAMPGFLEAARIHLVEASPRLREAQRARLAGREIVWHNDLGDVPDGPSILLANEFLDALPIVQLERIEAGWRERLVDYDESEGRFQFTLALHPTMAEQLLSPEQAAAPLGSVAEVSLAAISLITSIAVRLGEHGGAALFIDYGPAESALGTTLQALSRHERQDALEAPGTADLTAHVDFAGLARAAREAGVSVHGPVEQGVFLQRLGIRERAERLLAVTTPEQAKQIQSALRRLIDPAEMGTLFKMMTITHPAMPIPAGFEEVS